MERNDEGNLQQRFQPDREIAVRKTQNKGRADNREAKVAGRQPQKPAGPPAPEKGKRRVPEENGDRNHRRGLKIPGGTAVFEPKQDNIYGTVPKWSHENGAN